MRKYNKSTGELETAVCNCCGKKMLVEQGIVKEGICSVDVDWGYFSGKDGITQVADICEACMDRWMQSFRIPPESVERTELFEC